MRSVAAYLQHADMYARPVTLAVAHGILKSLEMLLVIF